MIDLNVRISYPGLSLEEEQRLCEHIRRSLQQQIGQVCGTFMRDPVGSAASQSLDLEQLSLDGTIALIDGTTRPGAAAG